MATIVGKDNAVVKRVTCRGCASIIEYTTHEQKSDYHSDYTGGKDFYKYITCPCCSKQVITS